MKKLLPAAGRAGRTLLAALVTTALLAACGGGGGNGSSSGEPTSPQATAPSITIQPQAVAAAVGGTAQFSVATSGGTQPISYQWQRDGADIAGATGASYTTPVLSAADNGASYRVIVRNAAGSVSSAAAVLTVTPASPTPGTASACYDDKLRDTPGASYEVAFRTTYSDRAAVDTSVETGLVSGPVSFNGHQAYEYTQTTLYDGVVAAVYKYYGRRTGPEERTEYGFTYGLDAGTVSVSTPYAPPVVDGSYGLAAGQSLRLSYVHTPDLTVTFTGIEAVTVPAGTYSACRFRLDSSTPAYANQRWILVGTGVVIKEVQSQPGLGSVTLEATAIKVNGTTR